MQIRFLSGFCAAIFGLVGLSANTAFAAITITVVATFDYPGVGNSTFPFGINSAGDIAGYYVDSSSFTRGFVRLRNGVLSSPIVEPNDTGNFTRALGINSARVVVGDYFNVATNSFHGYFLSGGIFTQYDYDTNPLSTALFGINDAGHFTGVVGSSLQPNQALANFGGTTFLISIPGAVSSFGTGINNLDQVVGSYFDSAGTSHGYLRNANGSLVAPIDVPNSISTTLQSINSQGFIVGRYKKPNGTDHGVLLKLPRTVVNFDYPGAVATSLNGINVSGLISRRYTDGFGLSHGFLAQVQN